MSAYVSGSTGNADSSSTTSHSIDLPGSAAVGDKIIVAIGIDSASTAFTFPAGWDVHFDDEDIVSTGTAAVYSKEYESGDAWPITVTTDVSERAAWMVQSIRDWGTLGGISASVGTGTGTTATIPDYTTGSDDELVFAIVVTDQVSGAHSTISGYSNQDTFGGTSAATVSMQSKVVASASTTETGNTVTWATSQEWIAMVVAFEPGTTTINATGGNRTGVRLGGAAIHEATYYPSGGNRMGMRLGGVGVASTFYYPLGGIRSSVRLGGTGLALTEYYGAGGLRMGMRLGGRGIAATVINETSRLANPARLTGSNNDIVLLAPARLAGAKLDNGL